jgi:hypothetical protein
MSVNHESNAVMSALMLFNAFFLKHKLNDRIVLKNESPEICSILEKTFFSNYKRIKRNTC